MGEISEYSLSTCSIWLLFIQYKCPWEQKGPAFKDRSDIIFFICKNKKINKNLRGKIKKKKKILFVRSGQGQRATKPKISTDITDRMCGFHLYLPWRGLPPAWAWLSPWAKPNFPVNMCIMGYTSTTPKSSLTSMAGILFQINF